MEATAFKLETPTVEETCAEMGIDIGGKKEKKTKKHESAEHGHTNFSQINEELKNSEPFLDPSGIKYVEYFLSKYKFTPLPLKQIVAPDGTVIMYDDLERKVILQYQIDYQAFKCPGKNKVSSSILKLAVTELIKRQTESEDARRKLISLFPFFGPPTTSRDLILDLVEIWTGKPDEVVAAIIRQFIWQVKRKILRENVFDPTVPVLCGPQDVGKSGVLKLFLEPLGVFTGEYNLADLLEAKSLPRTEKKFAMICNEFSGIQKVDMDVFKQIITEPDYTVRKFHTQDDLTFTVNASFIGTSNNGLINQIFDSTGVRRFFEIKVPRLIDFERLKQIDMVELWKSVDANDPVSPVQKNKPAIRERQAQFRNKNDLTIFLEEIGAFESDSFGNSLMVKTANMKKFSKTAFHSSYKLWAKRNGLKEASIIELGRRMKSMCIEEAEDKIGGKRQYHWLLPSEAILPMQ
jgi:hypothetical protein